MVVPTRCLCYAAPENKVRSVNDEQVEAITDSIIKRPDASFSIMLGHIDSNQPVSERDVRNGKYSIEILGGNHTLAAIKGLFASDGFNDTSKYSTCQVKVYWGLARPQILQLAIDHNAVMSVHLRPKYVDIVKLFRRELTRVLNTEDVPANLSKEDNKTWRSCLSTIMRVSNMQKFSSQYQNYLRVASLPGHIWQKVLLLFSKWDEGTIRGKVTGDLKQTAMINVTQECWQHLDDMVQGKITYQEFLRVKKPGKDKVKKSSDSSQVETRIVPTPPQPDKPNVTTSDTTASSPIIDPSNVAYKQVCEELSLVKKELADSNKSLEKALLRAERGEELAANLQLELQRLQQEYKQRELDLQYENKAKVQGLQEEITILQKYKQSDKKESEDVMTVRDEDIDSTASETLPDYSAKSSQEDDDIQPLDKRDSKRKSVSRDGGIRKRQRETIRYPVTKLKVICIRWQTDIYLAVVDGERITYCSKRIGHIRDINDLSELTAAMLKINKDDTSNLSNISKHMFRIISPNYIQSVTDEDIALTCESNSHQFLSYLSSLVSQLK
ncbi:unnamed protein product [Owenia fusiformis]|uniref:Uncharacterized protein n=1 Tax=Owenia fusiformis TaxID=6347 RepID=A0A8S4Q921_OWEFU|nr:unnamed protein product [Owenia fusiformis]